MNNTIYFYATLPKKGEIPFGGGEVGNVRTIKMLTHAGYNVIAIRQRKAKAEWGRKMQLFSYPFRIGIGWLEVFFTMLCGSREHISHLSGFAGVTILNEYVVMHIMKYLGYKVIYELRGGGAIHFWENGSSLYKKMFKYLVHSACYIFVQGKENIPLLESISKTPIYHYANCVEDGFAPITIPKKPKNRINLLFYGRVEKNKHIDLIVEVASIIQNAFDNVFLTIVGNGKPEYIDMVKNKMKQLLKENTYEYYAGCNHQDLPSFLIDKHFYIFPSTQPREGQSNSVTECMAYGIIPIASPQGFNRSTIGNNNLIVDELSAEKYANAIIGIIKSGKMEEYSNQVYNQFKNNYTQKIVFERTLETYKKIVS